MEEKKKKYKWECWILLIQRNSMILLFLIWVLRVYTEKYGEKIRAIMK